MEYLFSFLREFNARQIRPPFSSRYLGINANEIEKGGFQIVVNSKEMTPRESVSQYFHGMKPDNRRIARFTKGDSGENAHYLL